MPSKREYDDVLKHLEESGNLSKACRETGTNKSAFLKAVTRDPELAKLYGIAKDAGLDAEADRAIEEAINAKDANLGRLALDARKWYLSHLMPYKYGTLARVQHSGPDGGSIKTEHSINLSNLSDEELEHLERARTIVNRATGGDSDHDSDTAGEGTQG